MAKVKSGIKSPNSEPASQNTEGVSPPVEITELPAQVFVTKTFKNAAAANSDTDEILSVHKFLTEPGKVEFRAGLTLNLGNYETARIEIGMIMPAYREELSDAFEYAKEFVTTKLADEVEEIRNGKKKKKDEDPF